MQRHVHPACLSDEALLAEVSATPTRASGPGGQHRNKVSTAMRLVHRPTGVVALAAESREATRNREQALLRLRRRLAAEVRTPVELEGFEPSELFVRRTGGARLAVSEGHADAPALVAEALDVLAAAGDDPLMAASALRIAVSRFVKVLKLQPDVLRVANARWRDAGRPTYR